MPTYEFTCNTCGNKTERILKIAGRKDPELEPCDNCGKMDVKLIIGAAPQLMDPYRLGRIKHGDDFKETMRYIKRGNPRNSMKDY